MNILYYLFHNNDPLIIGDYIILSDFDNSSLVTDDNIKQVNTYYNRHLYSKVPFLINRNSKLTLEQLEIIKNKYDLAAIRAKETYKDEFEFLNSCKIYNNRIYNFYKLIKDIEFIPKTYEHITSLYQVLQNKYL